MVIIYLASLFYWKNITDPRAYIGMAQFLLVQNAYVILWRVQFFMCVFFNKKMTVVQLEPHFFKALSFETWPNKLSTVKTFSHRGNFIYAFHIESQTNAFSSFFGTNRIHYCRHSPSNFQFYRRRVSKRRYKEYTIIITN